jgi:hypothetical protein
MTHQVITVSESTPLPEIVRVMERHNVKRLPVVRGNVLVGIITRADLVRTLAQPLTEAAQTQATSDAIVLVRIVEELRKQDFGAQIIGNIRVMDGVAYPECPECAALGLHLTGKLKRKSLQAALSVQAVPARPIVSAVVNLGTEKKFILRYLRGALRTSRST